MNKDLAIVLNHRRGCGPIRPLGMITVRAEFLKFGQPQSVIFNLRADTAQPSAPVRIMRINHGARSIP